MRCCSNSIRKHFKDVARQATITFLSGRKMRMEREEETMAVFVELLLMGVGLAMDAFVVAMSKGMSSKRSYKNSLVIMLIKVL